MQIPLAPLWLHQSSKRRDSTMTAKNESHEALVAGFKYHFHPYLLGEMTQFDEQYFHQLSAAFIFERFLETTGSLMLIFMFSP